MPSDQCHGNVFMGKFERTNFYPCIQSFRNFCCRFIDDLFSLWNGNEREILDCIAKLNTYHPTKIFDYKYSQNSSDFLDTTIYDNKEQNKLLTIAYCKPIDRENFSHQKSAHPRSLLESIP